MILRRPPKHRPENFQGESAGMRFFRYIIIIICFSAVLWGVWESGSRRGVPSWGQSGKQAGFVGLSEAEREKIETYAGRFQQEYGVPIVVEVRGEIPGRAALNALAGRSGTADPPLRVVLILCPPEKRVIFLAPEHILAALGDEAKALAGPLFVPYFASGDWRSGLLEALNRMAARLDADLPSPSPNTPGTP